MTKHTQGPWSIEKESWLQGHISIGAKDHMALIQVVGEMDWEGSENEKTLSNPVYASWLKKNEELQANARIVAAAPELLEVLKWALPLAEVALDTHRLLRVQCGHNDIQGTYKDGVTWAGIYQDEVDKIEYARELLKQTQGE